MRRQRAKLPTLKSLRKIRESITRDGYNESIKNEIWNQNLNLGLISMTYKYMEYNKRFELKE